MAPQNAPLNGPDVEDASLARATGEGEFPHLQRVSDPGSLEGIRLLASLNEDERRLIEHDCLWMVAKEGDEILNRQSNSKHVIFLVEGRVEVVNYSLSGREVMYAAKESGDYFGEMSAIDGQKRSATIVALERTTIAALSPEHFSSLMLKHPQVAIIVLENLARIIRTCDERIMDLATLSAYQRVYSELIKLVRPDPVRPQSWLIYPLPTQAQIASMASTTRETVARVLSQLQQAGITQRKTKTLYIRDLERLNTLADRVAAGTPVRPETQDG